ncbi:MAG: hypothetical protein HND58_14925 [Planctomycetota bacterium]|nr:MAG: hypothetical protein HND58_14925 [Planctomycetota bacterium]
MSGENTHHHGFHGPKCWILSAVVGAVLGLVLGVVAPAQYNSAPHAPEASHAPEVEHQDHDPSHDTEPDQEFAGDDLEQSFDTSHLPDPVTLADASEDFPAIVHAEPDHADAADDQQDAAHGGDVAHDEAHAPTPTIPIWLVAPFALLLLSIAVMPFINEKFWHAHYPDFAFLLGGIMIAYYLFAYQGEYSHGQTYGQHVMLHTGLEYYSFIALIGGLFVASGGVLVDVRGKGGPVLNTALLATGAVMANLIGTTGASVLLIRPFMRVNKGRLKPIHVVMFIFIVSNCGGALTPIGDPPLYLGYLKGVPFQWTLIHLWPMWAAAIAMLLAIFFVLDTLISRKHPFTPEPGTETERASLRLRGTSGMIALGLIILGVFIDPMLKKFAGIQGYPIGPTFQIAVAITAYFVASREIHKANAFNFEPVKEVGLLFIGIFATMAPALGFLAAHGDSLGLTSPTAYYFGTGSLSAVLDNAPTYLNFLQVSFGEQDINSETVQTYLANEAGLHALTAISLGAVFFGAMTYIGNGPNFMVRAIAEAGGLRMPSFFGYLLRSIVLLLPVLVVIWAIFIR